MNHTLYTNKDLENKNLKLKIHGIKFDKKRWYLAKALNWVIREGYVPIIDVVTLDNYYIISLCKFKKDDRYTNHFYPVLDKGGRKTGIEFIFQITKRKAEQLGI